MTIAISNAESGIWLSSPPDGRSTLLSESLYEIVDGRIVEKPATGAYQTSVAINLLHFLLNHVRANNLGRANSEMLYLLDRDTGLKRRPDVSFVSYARWERTTQFPAFTSLLPHCSTTRWSSKYLAGAEAKPNRHKAPLEYWANRQSFMSARRKSLNDRSSIS